MRNIDHDRLMRAARRAHAAGDADDAAGDVVVLLAAALYVGARLGPLGIARCLRRAEQLAERMIDRIDDVRASA